MANNKELVTVLTVKTDESQQTIKGLKKEIADLKKQRGRLVDLKNWIVNSNKEYDSLISKFEVQAAKLPVGRIKQRTTVVR